MIEESLAFEVGDVVELVGVVHLGIGYDTIEKWRKDGTWSNYSLARRRMMELIATNMGVLPEDYANKIREWTIDAIDPKDMRGSVMIGWFKICPTKKFIAWVPTGEVFYAEPGDFCNSISPSELKFVRKPPRDLEVGDIVELVPGIEPDLGIGEHTIAKWKEDGTWAKYSSTQKRMMKAIAANIGFLPQPYADQIPEWTINVIDPNGWFAICPTERPIIIMERGDTFDGELDDFCHSVKVQALMKTQEKKDSSFEVGNVVKFVLGAEPDLGITIPIIMNWQRTGLWKQFSSQTAQMMWDIVHNKGFLPQKYADQIPEWTVTHIIKRGRVRICPTTAAVIKMLQFGGIFYVSTSEFCNVVEESKLKFIRKTPAPLEIGDVVTLVVGTLIYLEITEGKIEKWKRAGVWQRFSPSRKKMMKSIVKNAGYLRQEYVAQIPEWSITGIDPLGFFVICPTESPILTMERGETFYAEPGDFCNSIDKSNLTFIRKKPEYLETPGKKTIMFKDRRSVGAVRVKNLGPEPKGSAEMQDKIEWWLSPNANISISAVSTKNAT